MKFDLVRLSQVQALHLSIDSMKLLHLTEHLWPSFDVFLIYDIILIWAFLFRKFTCSLFETNLHNLQLVNLIRNLVPNHEPTYLMD